MVGPNVILNVVMTKSVGLVTFGLSVNDALAQLCRLYRSVRTGLGPE